VSRLAELLASGSYDGYAYSYPHKTAYRPLDPSVPLDQAWQDEDTSSLFLYIHLPFCEMRCGFCNLFTTVRPGQDFVDSTLSAIERQAREVAGRVVPRGVARAAIGGGTPSFLDEAQLVRLFRSVAASWPVPWGQVPLSLEISPGTVSPTKLKLLKDLGVSRLSMGVQSFLSQDLAALHRPELGTDPHQVCEWIRQVGFPVFNIDLIYGIEGQDHARWESNLAAALRWQPEELYLYPLYVGKLTSLDRLGRRPGEHRRALYRQARDRLLAAGYQQISMRLFRRQGVSEQGDYCCQEDGMVGLGPGARSYTRDLHYSTEYAVGQSGVRAIISAFAGADYSSAHYGVRLNDAERRRRYLLKAILRAEGLEIARYQSQFASAPADDFPGIEELAALGLARLNSDRWTLSERGLAYSDTIGPWLYSETMVTRMKEYDLR
jgi:oxygen-independent coproporphyrinogen-3 oxidase